MEHELISVIVPVYNVAPYLEGCLDSILAQTHKNLQIILVDDGSTDGSSGICDRYAARDPRIRVIHRENLGVSAARNAGLAAATGAWIGWVDSDDWIEPEMFARLLENAIRENAHMAICGRYQEYPDRRTPFGPKAETVLTGAEGLLQLLEETQVDNALYDKLYRRKLFDGIRFPEGRTFEDLAVLYRIFEAAERIACLPQPLYHYRQRPTGIIGNTCLDNRMNHFLAAKNRLEDLLPRHPEFKALLENRCATAAIGLWTAYYRNPKALRRGYLPRLKDVSRFAAPLCRRAAKAPGLGMAGKLAVGLVPHATPLTFAGAYLIGRLYERKHGRTL